MIFIGRIRRGFGLVVTNDDLASAPPNDTTLNTEGSGRLLRLPSPRFIARTWCGVAVKLAQIWLYYPFQCHDAVAHDPHIRNCVSRMLSVLFGFTAS